MQQRVKAISYLAKAVIRLEEVEQNYQALVLPKGAELLQLSLEVLSPTPAGVSASVGLNESEDFFMQDVDLSVAKTEASAKITQIKEISKISLNINQKANSGELVLRAFYFLPSEILTEY